MILTLDNLAHRYSLLPSEVLDRASTFDMFVIDVSAKYQAHQMDEEQRRHRGQVAAPKRMPTQEEMLDMMERVRNDKSRNTN